jgi:hypothetical protein
MKSSRLVTPAARDVTPAAQACPCSSPPGGVEGQTRWSEQSELTYTCENGQWHEGPYGYGAQS